MITTLAVEDLLLATCYWPLTTGRLLLATASQFRRRPMRTSDSAAPSSRRPPQDLASGHRRRCCVDSPQLQKIKAHSGILKSGSLHLQQRKGSLPSPALRKSTPPPGGPILLLFAFLNKCAKLRVRFRYQWTSSRSLAKTTTRTPTGITRSPQATRWPNWKPPASFTKSRHPAAS